MDEAELGVPDRVVRAVMAEAEAPRLGARRAGHDLVAQADPKQRAAVGDQPARELDRAVESRGVARPGREDDPVDLGCQEVRGCRGRGNDPHARAAPAEAPHDVGLEAEVDDRDQRGIRLRGRVADLDDLRRRDLPDEVLVLPAENGPGCRHGRDRIRLAGGGHDPAEAAARPEVARERARVQSRDRGDPGVPQERGQLAGVLEHGGCRGGHHEPPEPRPLGLVVAAEPPIVADQRVGHHDDLAGIRRVGADLLVAGLARVDHEVAARRDDRPEGDPGEDRAVLEREQGRTARADPRVDDHVRIGCRRDQRARPIDAPHLVPDTKTPPATGARRTWFDVCTMPPFRPLRTVRRPHGTGRKGRPKGSTGWNGGRMPCHCSRNAASRRLPHPAGCRRRDGFANRPPCTGMSPSHRPARRSGPG